MKPSSTRRQRAALAALSLLPLVGCASVLGLRDIDEGAPPLVGPDATAYEERPTALDGASDATADGGADVVVADAHRASACDRYPNALLCDDFEQTDAASPKWRTEYQGGGGSVTNRPSGSDAGPYPNVQDLTVGFGMFPPVGKAALAFDGLPGGRRSLRFSLWIPEDSYPSRLPVGGLLDATNTGVQIMLDPLADAGLGRRLLVGDSRDAGAVPLAFGSAAYRTWTCIEIQIDGNVLSARQDQLAAVTMTVSADTAASAKTAEVGVTWTFGAGADSLSMHYDDVVVATGIVGCD